jgi:L-ascorbate metabolism protein UlaG (beta-lactamase superfamily)
MTKGIKVSSKYYLREDVYVDPLINSWYAWPNLVAPMTYSMYSTKTHRRLINSFLNNHELHILANQDRSMAGGGEFVDCSADQLNVLRTLLNTYDVEYAVYQRLAEAIRELDALVRGHMSGETIEPLYEKVPDMLKGYVELTMDLNHQPSYRFIEGLLYETPYYDTGIQSVSFGLLSLVETRPFVLSTPRLADDRHLQIRVPLVSGLLDEIFRARTEPISLDDIHRLFGQVECKGGLAYEALFTMEAPALRHMPLVDGVRVQYTGHAGLMIETRDCSVLIDPVIASRTAAIADQMISYSQLPEKIDYVCLTHNHSDHVNLETLLQLRHKIGTVLVPKNNGGSLADPSLRLILKQLGFKVHEVDDLDEVALPGGRIISLPFLGEHGDLNIRSKTAWVVDLAGRKIYAGADSSNLEPRMYEHLRRKIGRLDVLAIGMECVGAPYTWLYGALNMEPVSKKIKESRRLNGSGYEKAARMVAAFEPARVFIYALGLEPWYGYFMGLDYQENSEQLLQSSQMVRHCTEIGVPVERLQGKHTLVLQ